MKIGRGGQEAEEQEGGGAEMVMPVMPVMVNRRMMSSPGPSLSLARVRVSGGEEEESGLGEEG